MNICCEGAYMDHDIFLAWLNETDNLSPGQLAEARRVLSGSAPFQTVVNLLEAKVREDRICPHCASEGAIIRGQASGLSRFFCKACGKTFNALTGTPLARLRHKSRWAEFAASLRDGETVKESAERCMVASTTAFRWRHRFLRAVTAGAIKLRGIVEADETFFLSSRKGERNLDRKARERGGKAEHESGAANHGRGFLAGSFGRA